MADPTLKISGDTTGAQAAIAHLERRIDSLNAKLKNVKPPKSPVPEPGVMETATAGLGKYLIGLASIATAVKLITNEWNNVIERQKIAGQKTVTFEEALGEAALNIGDIYSPDKLRKKALEMSAATGVSPATAAATISLAIKSGGATTEAEAEKFIPAAFAVGKLKPSASPDELAKSAGSVADYMARRNVGAEEATGVLLSMQSKSNIKDAVAGMEAFGPVVANMAAQGASDAMIQAMGPALTQAISDKSGEMSATSTVAFTKSLAEAGQSRFKGQKNIPDLMLAYLQQNPDEAREFFTGEMLDLDTGRKLGKPELGMGRTSTAFRSIAGDPTLEINEANESFRRQYEDLVKRAVSPDEAKKYYTARAAQVAEVTPTLRAQRTLGAGEERAAIVGREGLGGVTREGLEKLLTQTLHGPTADITRKTLMAKFDINTATGADPVQAVITELVAQADIKAYTEGETPQYKVMREVAKTLAEIRDLNKLQLDKQPPVNRRANIEPVDNTQYGFGSY